MGYGLFNPDNSLLIVLAFSISFSSNYYVLKILNLEDSDGLITFLDCKVGFF